MPVLSPVPVAPDSPFTLSNLPYGIFSAPDLGLTPRVGTILGDHVVDLSVIAQHGLFSGVFPQDSLSISVLSASDLHALAERPTTERQNLRQRLTELLSSETSDLIQNKSVSNRAFIRSNLVKMHLPFRISNFSDLTSSAVHFTNMAKIYGVPLPEQFREMPQGYNGRTSSIFLSGTDFPRPKGLFRLEGEQTATYNPNRKLDFEIEIGLFISKPLPNGAIVPASAAVGGDWAQDHLFGLVLMNDWSARDVQGYESGPLGPFHGKSFATSLSPWVVTLEALLEPQNQIKQHNSRLGFTRPVKELGLYEKQTGIFDIELSVTIDRPGKGTAEISICNLGCAIWSLYQLISYQSLSGCGLRTGDLIGSGTLSSDEETKPSKPSLTKLACLQEITLSGAKPLKVPSGEHNEEFEIGWLEDGDEIRVEGWARTPTGVRSIGFGQVVGRVQPVGSPNTKYVI